ncbi:3-dehydroquinate synthase [Bryobacter aggregatus]|uniref:3-dehydroquinate synthase n=1 Tax=Bryobacter aggregatus TaxID=360054 RepID=UPI0004E15222|nr:3-dehydroquinate synthase [Bryobacter aggregatus]
MATFTVRTATQQYDAIVERNAIARLSEFLPAKVSQIFVVTTRDVWEYHGETFQKALGARVHHVLYFPGGESNKRLREVEALAEQMMAQGADRASLVIGFGGGIVTDVAGFLAAIFLRGVPVIQVPTTLLGQVDAAVGGKTGVNLVSGKNLIGSFHQPLAVLIDPDVLRTLPEREYRAGLYEVLKCGVIRSKELFDLMAFRSADVLGQHPDVVQKIIEESVRIKCEVVTADEKEGDLRRILNFGHTVGHALEAETEYTRFLHGEAVAFGMNAATHLAHLTGSLPLAECNTILNGIELYGPIPKLDGIGADALLARLGSDKKTLHGKVHFVLPVRIGEVKVMSGVETGLVRQAIDAALAIR